MPDEHISWIDHVRNAENKIAKNIGSLYSVSHFHNFVISCVPIPI